MADEAGLAPQAAVAISVVINESIAAILADAASTLAPDGVLVQDSGTLDSADLPDGHARVTLYGTGETAQALRQGLRLLLDRQGSSAPIAVDIIPDQDWNAAWKAQYEPLDVGARIRVVPAWMHSGDVGDRSIVRIDPGQAFGTGTHETTRLVAQLLDDALGPPASAAALDVLDVGTGSGLLAIAAWRLGARRVIGVDNDPIAVASARENLDLNDASAFVTLHVADSPAELAPGRFGIVAANIISSVLLRLRDSLVERVAAGGCLLLSGVLAAEESGFVARFVPTDWTIERRVADKEWIGLQLRAPG